MNSQQATEAINLTTLFGDSEGYLIPIYQRNYAWKESHVNQLIEDILDYSKLPESPPYYIGTLVLYEKKIGHKYKYETIDGQQRLTTLFLIFCYLKNKFKKNNMQWFKEVLGFENRISSTKTLSVIYNNTINHAKRHEDINNLPQRGRFS